MSEDPLHERMLEYDRLADDAAELARERDEAVAGRVGRPTERTAHRSAHFLWVDKRAGLAGKAALGACGIDGRHAVVVGSSWLRLVGQARGAGLRRVERTVVRRAAGDRRQGALRYV